MQPWPAWPLYGLHEDLLPAAESCLARGEAFALATLVRIEGTSPRPLGSEMLIESSGQVHGYVSGGCVEAAVAQEALCAISESRPRMLDYGQGSPVLDIQLTCGGRIHIFARHVSDPARWVSVLRRARITRMPVQIYSDFATGRMHDQVPSGAGSDGFLRTYLPAPRLVLVGGDPVTLATAMLASIAGFEVVLWRPNGPLTPPEGIPLQGYLCGSPQSLAAELPLDSYSALYCLTHDMGLDVAILKHALESDAFCIGVLGSRSKHAQRLALLREIGVDADRIARLCAPAGLPIGASGPYEIAVSILAEIVSRQPRSRASTPALKAVENVA